VTDYLQANQPDILEVIANLSNDAVFTPPKVANAVLDLLPSEVWTDPTLRWLDPAAKTGVFPREITKRLMIGLAGVIPNEQERLRHILTEMVFAIATEEITGMMSRRSLYCSKDASSAYSVVPFATSAGNVWQKSVKHDFNDRGSCIECKGTRAELEIDGRDNKAYGFIHADGHKKIDKEMDMKFDVIVGNPPYQMSGGGGGSNDTPLYNVFVDEAIKLNPRFVSMIIPSRWMAGGRGLDDFRSRMLGDDRIRHLVDYADAGDLFPGVEIKGGVCYFLWDRENSGACSMTIVRGLDIHGPESRNLGEFDILVRDSRGLEILHKVLRKNSPSFAELVSGDTPFGLPSNFRGYRKGERRPGDVRLYLVEGTRVEKWIDSEAIRKNTRDLRKWKVLVPKAYGAGESWPHQILGQTIVAGPPSACTQTYLYIGPLESKVEAESVQSYISTRFFRFLVSLRKISQDAMKSVYTWVPQQSWDQTWTDAELYKKYGITKDEQAYIESIVREMPA
jgi:site-specific DNA-methyltransferase (adenine-specific)